MTVFDRALGLSTDPLIAVSVSDGSLDFTNSNTAPCRGSLLKAHGSLMNIRQGGGEAEQDG